MKFFGRNADDRAYSYLSTISVCVVRGDREA